MSKQTITCPACGGSFTVDKRQPQAFCPRCGQKLPEDILPKPRKPFFPQEEAIPDLPTQGAQPKTPAQYAREALRWAVIVAAFIGVLGMLYSLAARLAG